MVMVMDDVSDHDGDDDDGEDCDNGEERAKGGWVCVWGGGGGSV